MNRNLMLLLLVSLAVRLVKSESIIEVDENGDEYEVKRFNIPGRQLHEGRSQCVEIRSKRAVPSLPQPLYRDYETENTDNDSENLNGAPAYYSPPVISSAIAAEDDEAKEDVVSASNEMNKKRVEVMAPGDLKMKNNTKNKQSGEKKVGNDDTMGVIEWSSLEQLQNADESLAAVAAHVKDETNTDDIVVVQAHKPPKVNSQTHAVFELRPVEEVTTKTDFGEEDQYGETDFDYTEELTPISTAYILSTDDLYDDYNQMPFRVQKVKWSKTQDEKKPKHKTKYSNMASGNKNHNKNKPGSDDERPLKVPKMPTNKINKKPAGTKNKVTMNAAGNKIRTSNRHRYYTSRNRVMATKNKNRENAETFTRTYTWAGPDEDTNSDQDDTNVACIIIRKDSPTTTTPRPFWKFWSRSNNGARQASRHFGNRKRANLRFVA